MARRHKTPAASSEPAVREAAQAWRPAAPAQYTPPGSAARWLLAGVIAIEAAWLGFLAALPFLR